MKAWRAFFFGITIRIFDGFPCICLDFVLN